MSPRRPLEIVEIPHTAWTILPPAEHLCQVCAVDHEPEMPHNPDSFYWKTKFHIDHDRLPTWADALEHCSPEVRASWVSILATNGVVVEGPA